MTVYWKAPSNLRWVSADFLDDSGRVAANHHIVRDILRDNSPGSNDGIPIKKTYTYTAYTDPEYQGVTDPLAYTDTYTDILLKKTT